MSMVVSFCFCFGQREDFASDQSCKGQPEAEFMNVQFCWGILVITLRVLRPEVSLYNIYIANQFQTTFAQGGWEDGKIT